jgi:hypothetical protein
VAVGLPRLLLRASWRWTQRTAGGSRSQLRAHQDNACHGIGGVSASVDVGDARVLDQSLTVWLVYATLRGCSSCQQRTRVTYEGVA